MSEDRFTEQDSDADGSQIEAVDQADALADGNDYEEISSDEVDRIVAALEELMDSADSENIKLYLEEAINNIFYLVYEDEAADVDPQIDAA